MEQNQVEQKIINVFWDKFQFHADRLSDEQRRESLLKPEIGFQAVDLFVLYMELEEIFGIRFDEADVIENRFDVYNNILNSVKNHLTKDMI